MAGFSPNEAETFRGNLLFKNITTDRGTNHQLGLFTNAAADETITEATITEPTGTGYARITLVDATWNVTADVVDYALQTFTGGAGGWTGSIFGYFVNTNGTTARATVVEIDGNGPYTIAENDTYDITLNITMV